MIFLWSNSNNLEEDEEEEATGLNDELLDELNADELDPDLLEGEDAILPPPVVDPVLAEEEEVEEVAAFLEDEEDEEDADYDSFDDKDDL
jgi:hypothetical protein